MKQLAIGVLIVFLVLSSGCIGEEIKEKSEGTNELSNQNISGMHWGDQIWSGEILITGDTHLNGNLAIMPGTIVKFVVGDDVGSGMDVPADGYNDLDPTRFAAYEKTHSHLHVEGKLIARGEPDNRIIFTSAAEEPYYADWLGISMGDGSLVEYCLVEWSRHGLSLGNNNPNTIIRYNIINYTYWGSISSDKSGAHIYNNEIWETGHEGIDVQGGDPIIENNKIYNAHTGIVILDGSAIVRNNTMINVGDGIHVEDKANPTLINNYVEYGLDDSKNWTYGNFAYMINGEPIIIP